MTLKIYHYFILLTLIFLAPISHAQDCGMTGYEAYLEQKFPGFSKTLEQTRQEALNNSNRLNKSSNDSVFRIPVVFHIVWNEAVQNIHDSLIFSQIKALNECFNHTHKDTGNIRGIFKPVIGRARIEFYLATRDPNGKLTNGINRVKTTRTDFSESGNLYADDVKSSWTQGVDAWNPEKYLNIWVCKFTFNGQVAVSAYAYPPTNAKFWNASIYRSLPLQGVVINYQYVGANNPGDVSAISIRERTLVHEIGHYLGLRHIWADKNNTCNGEDDGFKDTPLARTESRNCTTLKNGCNEGTGDLPDMYENYMDYSSYPCTVMFTAQQVNHMRYNIINLRPKVYEIKDQQQPNSGTIISVAPNPIVDELKILFDSEGNYEINLTDAIGQIVMNRQIMVNSSLNYNTPIHLSSGIYILNLSKDGKSVLKQRVLVK